MSRRLVTCAMALTMALATSAEAQLRDHLQCFKIKDSATKAEYTADLATGNAELPALEEGCTIKLPAKQYCVDVAKQNVSPTPPGGITGTAARDYLCYKATCPKVQPAVEVTDQFGNHPIEVKVTSMVCAPIGAPCAAGELDCGGVCVDPAVDPDNCGACGIACADGDTCTGGTCFVTCDAGTLDCAGTCIDPGTDPQNCGACGIVCGAGEECTAGACSCPAGTTGCSGSCVDVTSDEDHCGACNTPCLFGMTCTSGVCS